MASLMLLRHAKSDWDAEFSHDRDRPLNRRGVLSAQAIGRFVTAHRLTPTLALTSPAVRAVDTLQLAVAAGGWETQIRQVPQFYGAAPDDLLQAVRGVSDAPRLLLVGHEPTMSLTLSRLIGSAVAVPTGTLISLHCPGDSWADTHWGAAQLELFVKPSLLLRSTQPPSF